MGNADYVAVLLKACLDEVGDVGFILYEKDPFHGRYSTASQFSVTVLDLSTSPPDE